MNTPAQSPLQTETSPEKDRLLGLVLGLIGVLIFSGTLPVTKLAIAAFDPGFLTFGRASLATAAAVITLLIMRKRFPIRHLGGLLLCGITLVYGFPGFMALAMQTVPSSHGGVVLGILPLTTSLFAVLIAGERPSAAFWFWNFLGAALIMAFTFRDSGFGFVLGDLWLLIAGITASAGYVMSGKLSREMRGWEVISWALILCSPLSFFGAWWFWDAAYLTPPPFQIANFLYLGFGSMFLGFFAWNTGLKLGGISRIGQLQLLQTFFTLAIAAVLVGETVTMETLAFAVAVLGVVLAGRKAQVR